jgi:hypothetical protein
MSDAISPEAFKVLLERAGITVKPENMEEMRTAYGLLQAMREQVRKARGHEAEPAHIFTPAGR